MGAAPPGQPLHTVSVCLACLPGGGWRPVARGDNTAERPHVRVLLAAALRWVGGLGDSARRAPGARPPAAPQHWPPAPPSVSLPMPSAPHDPSVPRGPPAPRWSVRVSSGLAAASPRSSSSGQFPAALFPGPGSILQGGPGASAPHRVRGHGWQPIGRRGVAVTYLVCWSCFSNCSSAAGWVRRRWSRRAIGEKMKMDKKKKRGRDETQAVQ
ncbi:hypothetical protein ACCO45_011637 [Purpureocillium lilacinum]|uniref:Uncharacterized protein n=1 Tax=Purpureocillium lilacinum TaxID=33203 RepID=A0ACC4DDZ0_PURLI